MTPITINRLSSFYRVMNKYGNPDGWQTDPTDICACTKRFIKGVFFICFFTGVVGAVLGLYVDLGLWAYANYFIGHVGMHDRAIGATILLAIIGIVIAVVGPIIVYKEYQSKRRALKYNGNAPPPSAISQAWKSFREKTCVPVEFK